MSQDSQITLYQTVDGKVELEEKSTVQNLHSASSDKPVKFYNLDVIISVGYRVKSIKGTQFRIWATQRLREYLVQGYTLNQLRFDQNDAELQQALKQSLLVRGQAIALFAQPRGTGLRRCWAISINRYLANPPFRRWKARRRTCGTVRSQAKRNADSPDHEYVERAGKPAVSGMSCLR